MSLRRTGFTLVELLVVVTILGVLVALSVGGITQLRTSQRVVHARQTVVSLQQKLNDRVSRTIDKARSPLNPNRSSVLAYCGNDPDLADSVLCYGYLKVEFPETFTEAGQGFTIVRVIDLLPSLKFATVPTTTPIPAADQAAILLYLTLQSSEGVEIDGANVAVDTATGWHYYKDSFGKPIMFRRWYEELPDTNQAPYTNAKSSAKDPLDPFGKLSTWSGTPVLRGAANCMSAGDNNNKLITIQSSPLPSGEVVWGFRELARK